uniref:Protein TSSC1 n=1 Tax=Lepeophtheirus salmonis TaxID=72036 RepID=D3PI46_LEPSM|nr:Protein TSSC1 [Lepeophtheirus salmonis]
MSEELDMGGGGCIYGLEYQCRALTSFNIGEDEERAAFLVGTQSIKSENQIHWLEYDEDIRNVRKKRVWIHSEGEIWQLAGTCKNLFLSVYAEAASERRKSAKVWRVLGDCEEDSLEDVCTLEPHNSDYEDRSNALRNDIIHASWHPFESHQVISISPSVLTIHDINENKSSPGPSPKKLMSFGTWNPHQNASQFATVHEYEVRGWDLRSNECGWKLENPGGHVVRSMDFNPNKQYHLATAGDDGKVRVWDIRNTDTPLASHSFGHSHWIWSIQFNQYHDQLILTGGSDALVAVSALSSLSSEPYLTTTHSGSDDDQLEEDESSLNSSIIEDGIIKAYTDHEDSVYRAEWSHVDPWTFASLSYDGRLVINQVPRGVKLKILNLV